MPGKVKKRVVVGKKIIPELLSREQVMHVAILAKLDLTEAEINLFQKQLSEIITYVSQLQKVDTSKIKETSQVTGLENIFQSSPSQTLPLTDVLRNAPAEQKNLFQVSSILKAK